MLWGSRFSEDLSDEMLKFTSSISVDINLFYEDIKVSKAHAKMLNKIGILSQDELNRITKGLSSIEQEYSEGSWIPSDQKYEDIHSAVEHKLKEKIGEAADKLHTGRSRNDQVATDFRLWIKDKCNIIIDELKIFQRKLISIAEDHIETIIPGYTHLQRAQPVSLAFHLLAYVEMAERSIKRFEFVLEEADICPLGSGSMAGSTILLDREFTAKELGFSVISKNALDSVSDRDFALDFLNACNAGTIHLSKLCEELIIWSSQEFGFIRISDSFTTGSSLMPQKKNPDLAELIRAKTGKMLGDYSALSTLLKSLPLSYNRDLQEDKPSVFSSYENYLASIKLMGEMLINTEFNFDQSNTFGKNDFSLATDITDWLVQRGIPFRKAHTIIGKIVKYAEENNKGLNKLTLSELKKFSELFDSSAAKVLNIESSLQNKRSYGSPNPAFVKTQIKNWQKKLGG